jgi:sterol desaturase/sphingolipid hydroxylase (fatty acid hydroxylase superfamily)
MKNSAPLGFDLVSVTSYNYAQPFFVVWDKIMGT